MRQLGTQSVKQPQQPTSHLPTVMSKLYLSFVRAGSTSPAYGMLDPPISSSLLSTASIRRKRVLGSEAAASRLVALDVGRDLSQRAAATAARGQVVLAAAAGDLESVTRVRARAPNPNGEHDVPDAAGEAHQDAEQERDRQGDSELHHAQTCQHLGQRDARAKGDHEAVGHAVLEAPAERGVPFADRDVRASGLGRGVLFDLNGVGLVGRGHGAKRGLT
ncbi:unnamed protein product [Phytophthora lilii]|uniref:Unnamed protein product n=1 Tax=Phytophthora lilii TaxID=2077276 RepID=A0A9W6TYE5_9STRA|nr:unnamed protein product [Phytophthora lilii]